MTNPLSPSSLLTPIISSAGMRDVLHDRARLQRMLDFEVALAQAALGIVPALAIDQIANAARVEDYDLATLGQEAVVSGHIAIPLIAALTTQVAKTDPTAARYVHWGASSQDEPEVRTPRAASWIANFGFKRDTNSIIKLLVPL